VTNTRAKHFSVKVTHEYKKFYQVLFANIIPLTRCDVWMYGDFLDTTT